MAKPVFLSVVIPAYNESENLKRGALEEALAYLKEQSYSWELILSDDGSSDGSIKQLRQFTKKDARIKLLENEHMGKAGAVSRGMLAAQGTWRLFTDFDQSTPLVELEKLLPYTEQGFAIMIGSREMIGSMRSAEPWYRHWMGRGFNWLVQLLAVPGILDTQCGFKLFSALATKQLFPRLKVYGQDKVWRDAFTGAFDVELLFLAKREGFQIREVPIRWIHASTNRVNPVKDSLRMFRDIVRIRLAHL